LVCYVAVTTRCTLRLPVTVVALFLRLLHLRLLWFAFYTRWLPYTFVVWLRCVYALVVTFILWITTGWLRCFAVWLVTVVVRYGWLILFTLRFTLPRLIWLRLLHGWVTLVTFGFTHLGSRFAVCYFTLPLRLVTYGCVCLIFVHVARYALPLRFTVGCTFGYVDLPFGLFTFPFTLYVYVVVTVVVVVALLFTVTVALPHLRIARLFTFVAVTFGCYVWLRLRLLRCLRYVCCSFVLYVLGCFVVTVGLLLRTLPVFPVTFVTLGFAPVVGCSHVCLRYVCDLRSVTFVVRLR